MADYFRPDNLNEALLLLDQQLCQPLAGGTDFYPAQINSTAWGGPGIYHSGQPVTLDLSAIQALQQIHDYEHYIEIGAMMTWSELIHSELPLWLDGLKLAGREVGGLQIQNRATLAGNLCNASPAADGVPALIALDAKIRLQSLNKQRELALKAFILGNRQTARRDNELVTAILIPKFSNDPQVQTRSTFLKLGARRYLVISIAMVAITLSYDDNGAITHAAIAVGACSEVARRLTTLERRLSGQLLINAASQVRETDFESLTPLDDVRASAAYRRHSAQVLVKRGLAQLADKITMEQAA